jgi:HSP20 family protein
MKTVMTYNPNALYSVFDNLQSMMGDFLTPDVPIRNTYPPVDIREEKEHFIIEAELPGLTEKTVDIKIQDRVLTLASLPADKSESVENQTWLLRERRPCTFRRSFTLPRNIDLEKINAVFKDGLLTITLPISPDAMEKTISISRG